MVVGEGSVEVRVEPEWLEGVLREMRALKKGDVIRLYYRKGSELNQRYHVRGRVDDWLVVRFWRRSCGQVGWGYKCLSPAWWSVVSQEPCFKVVKGRCK